MPEHHHIFEQRRLHDVRLRRRPIDEPRPVHGAGHRARFVRRRGAGVWLGDSVSGRTVAVTVDHDRSWVGTFDDPFAIELEQNEPFWLNNTDLAGNVAAIGVVRNGGDSVLLFDATTGEQIGEPIGDDDLVVVAVDPTGSFAAISHQDFGDGAGRLRVFEATTGEELFLVPTEVPANSLTFDTTTSELIAGMDDGRVMTVDLVTGVITSDVATTATSRIIELGVRADGLIVAVSNGQIELVDRRIGPTGIATEMRDIVEARVRADGTVVTLGIDGQHEVIELDGNALVERSWPAAASAWVSFDGGRAAIINTGSQEVTLVDLATGERTDVDLRDRDGNLFVAAAVSPEEGGVSALAASGIVARWEGSTMVERIDLPGALFTGSSFGDRLATLGVDAEDNRVASVSSVQPETAGVLLTVAALEGQTVHPGFNGGLHVFDADGTLRTFDADGEPISEIATGAAFSTTNAMDPTTGALAVNSFSGGIFVIDPTIGDVQRLPGNDFVANLGFARDGQLLVITGFDGTVRLWDLERSEPAGLVWDGSGASPSSPSWYDESTDSIWVFTSGQLIEVPLDPARWIQRACEIVGRDLTVEEWNRYVPGDDAPQSACT